MVQPHGTLVIVCGVGLFKLTLDPLQLRQLFGRDPAGCPLRQLATDVPLHRRAFRVLSRLRFSAARFLGNGGLERFFQLSSVGRVMVSKTIGREFESHSSCIF